MVALVLFGPYLLANYSTTWAGVLIAALVVVALVSFWPNPSLSPMTAWAHEHPMTLGIVLLFVGGETVLGLLNGVAARSEEARQAAESAQWNEADRRRRAEQDANERRARAESERVERQRAESERLADARRTPEERATLVVSMLSGDATNLEAKVCRARQTLAPLTRDQLRVPLVRSAVRRLRAVERAALRQIRDDAREGRKIMCCDGTTSPTCECERSDRRGCCSHHNGICGCEPLPSEITCPAPR